MPVFEVKIKRNQRIIYVYLSKPQTYSEVEKELKRLGYLQEKDTIISIRKLEGVT